MAQAPTVGLCYTYPLMVITELDSVTFHAYNALAWPDKTWKLGVNRRRDRPHRSGLA